MKSCLLDGNARAMSDSELVKFIREENIGLVGIGSMTRMIARAYRVADSIRSIGVPVVMGGPHVTELPDEALGRDGGPRHADAVALGEADETWPQIVHDASVRSTQGSLQTRGATKEERTSSQACNLIREFHGRRWI